MNQVVLLQLYLVKTLLEVLFHHLREELQNIISLYLV